MALISKYTFVLLESATKVQGLEYQNNLQRSVSSNQWLRKNQARPAIVKEQKTREKVSYALFLNSGCSGLSPKARQGTD